MGRKKMTKAQAQLASYTELLTGQTRWVKDEQGEVHKVKGLDLAETLTTLSWYVDQREPLWRVGASPVDSGTDPVLWLRAQPLFAHLAVRAMAMLALLPPEAIEPLMAPVNKHVLATRHSVFYGELEELAEMASVAAEHAEQMHPPTPMLKFAKNDPTPND